MTASLPTLPTEVLHRILDYLDTETILFSVRTLSRRFCSVVQSFNRHMLNLNYTSGATLDVITRLIRPDNITALTLVNNMWNSTQIQFFISHIPLKGFTRLHTLTLTNIGEGQMNDLLREIDHRSLKSFAVSIRQYDERRRATTERLLTSIITQPNLRRLELDIKVERLKKISSVTSSSIEHLTITSRMVKHVLLLLPQRFLRLHTLSMKGPFPTLRYDNNYMSRPAVFCTQITALTIDQFNVGINLLESVLMYMPALTHFKLTGTGDDLCDGQRWERFIQPYLPRLGRFEFFFHELRRHRDETFDPQSIISSFQTPFWLEEKKWFVTCEYTGRTVGPVILYSLPLCTPRLKYQPSSRKVSLSTCPTGLSSTRTDALTSVHSLELTLSKALAKEINEQVVDLVDPHAMQTRMSESLFPRATQVSLTFEGDWSSLALPSLHVFFNLSHIVQMSVCGYDFDQYEASTIAAIAEFLKQACNLTSLALKGSRFGYHPKLTLERIYSIIPGQLKHLHVPVETTAVLGPILERCPRLGTLQLDYEPRPLADMIIQWFEENTKHSVYHREYKLVRVWLGTRRTPSSDVSEPRRKRIKLLTVHTTS